MTLTKELCRCNAAVAALVIAGAILAFTSRAAAQDLDDDDPSGRVARLAYMQGSVSLEPAGESDWVEAVSNRPLTIGDRLWTDRGSRAELQLGSAAIRLDSNTDFSFLNLDDRSTQIQLAAGALNIRVRWLDRDEFFEVDTPNQAFWVTQPGRYRVEASDDGTYTVVSVREGEGQSTGNGQNYSLHAGQRWTFSGTDPLTADVAEIGGPDEFDNWAYSRERRFDDSRSAQYVSRDVVGYDDLDDYGEWRDDREYGHVWFPSQVESGWAPYRAGHWDWIAPWGWTWVDDAPWGYAPFHYGRWVFVGQRWGWVAGPPSVRPVYAPALVAFLGSGAGFGENVGWFPLAPHEVYVPWYRVSRRYVERVNETNTSVSTTTITNVYNTTIVQRTTNITNVTYVNRNVQGAVTAVPQRTFVSAQPVARAVVAVNSQQVVSAPVTAKVSLAPTRQSVLGARANTANRVTAPPPAIRNRQVVAKTAPPPPPIAFDKQQQAMSQHPGEPPSRRELQNTRPAAMAEAYPAVKMAPPGKPATPNVGRPANQPSPPRNRPNASEAGQPANNAPPNEPATTAPEERPANRPSTRPESNRRDETPSPQPNRRPQPQPTRPEATPDNERNQPEPRRAEPNRPEPKNQPEPRSAEPNPPEPSNPSGAPKRNDRMPVPSPENRTEPNRPSSVEPDNRPERALPNEPPGRSERPTLEQPNNPKANEKPDSPKSKPNSPAEAPKQSERNNPPASKPNPSRPSQAREPQTAEERKQQEQERRKKEQQQKRQQQKEQQQEEQQKPPDQ